METYNSKYWLKRRVWLIILLVLLSSCGLEKTEKVSNQDTYKLDEYLVKLKSQNNQYKYVSHWEVLEKREIKNGVTNFIIKNSGSDTLIISSFFYHGNGDSVEIHYLTKEFMKGGYKHFLEFKRDTLYYYKYDTVNKSKEFIAGEYSYKNRRHKLGEDEVDYYYEYKDSLDKVKGNNLPKLPKLSSEDHVSKEEELVPEPI